MNKTVAIFVVLVFSVVSTSYADYTVSDSGMWPKSWPAELEPLRKQACTLEGPTRPSLHYAIPFTKQDEFESAWPHLLKIKSKGAPIVLKRAPSFWLGDKATAGVCVHTPPKGEAPIADGKDAKRNWEKTIYIELIVDGEIIDLNRIPLPADTPIIDERFSKNGPEKQSQQSTRAEDRVAHLEEQLKTLQKEMASHAGNIATRHAGSAAERSGKTSRPITPSVQAKCRRAAEARRIKRVTRAIAVSKTRPFKAASTSVENIISVPLGGLVRSILRFVSAPPP